MALINITVGRDDAPALYINEVPGSGKYVTGSIGNIGFNVDGFGAEHQRKVRKIAAALNKAADEMGEYPSVEETLPPAAPGHCPECGCASPCGDCATCSVPANEDPEVFF